MLTVIITVKYFLLPDSMDTTGRLRTAGEVLRSLGIEDQDLNNNGHTSKASSSRAAQSPSTSDEMTTRPPHKQTGSRHKDVN